MRRLFRSFERFGLEYLLISGQATILYGAATFSEDIDIWIAPTGDNARRLLEALAACRARIHKLTPPLTVKNMRAGHGFHFTIPDRPLVTYLDVMARPPRVGTFGAARRRARVMKTGWGALPVVGPVELVELKKTRRLADYDVITNLVTLHVAQRGVDITPSELAWAARNCFRPEERVELLSKLGTSASIETCAREIAREVADLQRADREYWSRIHAGTLLAVKTPVAKLV